MEKHIDRHKYDEIFYLKHHQSLTRPHMSVHDRAAQFSPFAALTGYEGAVKEAARLTDRRIELDETQKAVLNKKMQLICKEMVNQPEVTITYFVPDNKKSGGTYVSKTGQVKKVNLYEKQIIMQDQTVILMEEIADIQGEIMKILDQ